VRQVYTVLRAVLDDAKIDGLIADNPAAKIVRPRVARREARHLDAGQVAAILTAAEGRRYRDALVLIAATGMRKGEALALRWEHVNLKDGSLRVAATLSRVGTELVITEPKSARSRRTIPLSPAIVAMLTAHRVTQAAERLHAGGQWINSGLVFASEFGTPVDRATSCGPSRLRQPRQVSPTSVCTPCGTVPPWPGWKPVCTSRRLRTCWGTARSASPETSTGTRRMQPRGPLSTG
jgi:integrase